MKNINNKSQVEVMALFSYGLNPCQPLKFKQDGRKEMVVSDLLKTQIKFLKETTLHIFEVVVGAREYTLEFDSKTLKWYLVA